MADRTAGARVARYEDRMRASGFVKKHLWVPHDGAARIEAMAAEMRRRHKERPPSTLQVVLAALRRHESELRGLGVVEAAVFGSVARGEDSPESDVDILIRLDPAARMGLIGYAGIARRLEEIVGRGVDMADRATLKELVRPAAEAEAVLAF